MWVKARHEFITVVSHVSIAREILHGLPRFRQEDRRIADQKRDPHDEKEFQKAFLPDDPASGDSLESVVIADRDRDHHRYVL